MTAKESCFSDYLRPEELARELNITDRTLRRWERLRIGPPRIKAGPRRIFYKVADVRAWLDAGGAA